MCVDADAVEVRGTHKGLILEGLRSRFYTKSVRKSHVKRVTVVMLVRM